MKQYILGADPGLHGAFALLSTTFSPALFEEDDLILYPFPKFKGEEMTSLDVCAMNAFLSPYRDMLRSCYIEHVHGIAKTSAKAMFGFGFSTGVTYATLAALCGVKIHRIFPFHWQRRVWKEHHIVWKDAEKRKKDTKATSLNCAKEVFRNFSFVMPRCRTPHDGCVDAALIAYAGLISSNE